MSFNRGGVYRERRAARKRHGDAARRPTAKAARRGGWTSGRRHKPVGDEARRVIAAQVASRQPKARLKSTAARAASRM
jgi:hypothetical protein